ncbi:putative U6 snRna-associated sm family protein Lsm2 [Cardiosporidium cionae]|uniref:U6 snRNA-associated Sm-like protein LSm2 n=1 Tax=Cardiosporidium cionae TaxID=476202 RepID=A0ABQ7J6J8_9APIC|nr:putative U6 snRna-associated sm family protein Lsm2 [Cardiosporidium cionae]|eukprot:KAF8819612.1 putative U6 snRna-associated sm family protein Lsm2 [Cardiosporidium cionae]
MLFFNYFQNLVEKNVPVMIELKNDLQISGTLHSVDQHLNFKVNNVSVNDPEKYPHLLSVKNCFVRGSVVRYVHLPPAEVDTEQLQNLCRKDSRATTNPQEKGK